MGIKELMLALLKEYAKSMPIICLRSINLNSRYFYEPEELQIRSLKESHEVIVCLNYM